jgi:predicted metal-dependent phosphoesterase TrpH
MTWTAIVHAHSRRSYDGVGSPAELAEEAVRLGAHVLAITDHDTWTGSIEAADHARARGLPLLVVRGSEVATDEGDVLALFVEEDPVEKHALALCDRVHAQGGLIVLPHPCRFGSPSPELVGRADLIEVFNARTPKNANVFAQVIADTSGKPATVAPDAHRIKELGLARIVFDGPAPADLAAVRAALLHAPRTFEVRAGSIWDEWRSQAVKCVRRPDAALALHLARGVVRRLVKPAEYRAT